MLPLLCLPLLGHGGHEGGALSGLALVAALPAEPAAMESAQAVARELGRFVPGVQFEAATAAGRGPLAAGLHTGELILAVLTPAEALAIAADEAREQAPGRPPGASPDAAPGLRVLAHLEGGLLLVSDRSLGAEHAYMVLFALYDPAGRGLLAADYRAPRQVLARAAAYPVPLHSGAREFLVRTAELKSGG